MTQHMVARVMAKDIVDLLEPVEIEEEEGGGSLVPLQRPGRPLHLLQIAPVRQTRQRVMQRAVLHLDPRGLQRAIALFRQLVGKPERLGLFMVLGDIHVEPDKDRPFRRLRGN